MALVGLGGMVMSSYRRHNDLVGDGLEEIKKMAKRTVDSIDVKDSQRLIGLMKDLSKFLNSTGRDEDGDDLLDRLMRRDQ